MESEGEQRRYPYCFRTLKNRNTRIQSVCQTNIYPEVNVRNVFDLQNEDETNEIWTEIGQLLQTNYWISWVIFWSSNQYRQSSIVVQKWHGIASSRSVMKQTEPNKYHNILTSPKCHQSQGFADVKPRNGKQLSARDSSFVWYFQYF